MTKVNGDWIYLSVILDLYSRKIVGWSLGKDRTTALRLRSWSAALANRKRSPGLIFHSDKGAEYGAHVYQEKLRSVGIRPSMNRKNTMIDSIQVEEFEGIDHLQAVTKWYLEEYYNCARVHTSLNFMSPDSYERMAA